MEEITHEEAYDKLQDFAKGDCEPEILGKISRHISSCKNCSEALFSIQSGKPLRSEPATPLADHKKTTRVEIKKTISFSISPIRALFFVLTACATIFLIVKLISK